MRVEVLKVYWLADKAKLSAKENWLCAKPETTELCKRRCALTFRTRIGLGTKKQLHCGSKAYRLNISYAQIVQKEQEFLHTPGAFGRKR